MKVRVTYLRGEGESSMEVRKRWEGKEPTARLSNHGLALLGSQRGVEQS